MRSFHPGRIAILALTVTGALACAGCPELNRYPDRSTPGQFSVDDPVGRSAGIDAEAQSAAAPRAGTTIGKGTIGPTQFMLSEEGGLPDQSRRAH
jgi:hypothetical protein